VLADDKAALIRYYRDRGYLDARADARIQPSPNGREASITFFIDEGPLYTLRSIHVRYGGVPSNPTDTDDAVAEYREKVLHDPRANIQSLTPEQMQQVGRGSFTEAQVGGLMLMKPGDAYSDDKLRKSLDAIRAAYGKLGSIAYVGVIRTDTVLIDPRPVRDGTRPEIDLYLFLEEGRRYLTGDVVVRGNEFTKQQVILREIEVKPGRPLDAAALEKSKQRLEELRLFAPGSVKLTIQPPANEDPRTRDVLAEVAETNTGRFNIGAAVSSDGGVVGLVGIEQNNFDIADVPGSFGSLITGHAFRGAGQTSSLQIQPGTEVSLYSYTLTEPHLFESDYSLSGTGFYREREYDQYDERRFGGRVGLGRRFGTVWTGNLITRVESVDLSDIEPDAPVDVFAVEDQRLVTGLGVSFVRTTVDNRYRPTRGNRLELGAEQAGALGGDYDFTHLRYSYDGFFPIYESFLGYKTVLRLSNRVEYIPQGQGSAPVYERLYLGGQSFRGFNFRAVSPIGIRNDTGTPGDDPVGGTFLFFLGAEIQQPVYKDVASIVGFIDTGTVNERFGFQDYRVSAGFGIRLYIRQLSPVPLAFDFGFPVLKNSSDRERVFTFSLDIPYQ
jgi:outer membrane protein insertion porin family